MDVCGFCHFLPHFSQQQLWAMPQLMFLPSIDENVDYLNAAQWFTSLDLKSGYRQIEMDE